MVLSHLSQLENKVESLDQLLAVLSQIEPLMDSVPNLVFFVKDTDCRYQLVNQTLVERCGMADKAALLGYRADQVFPLNYGRQYTAQDRKVVASGKYLEGQLELHFYAARDPGWCMTSKRLIRNECGDVIALVGISRDLQAPQASHPAFEQIAAVDRYIHCHFSEQITLSQLCEVSGGLSIAQMERLCRRIFHLTPRQMIQRVRLDHAAHLLSGNLPITEIALRCGYSDHSAFSRQFRAITGFSPSQFRASTQR